MYKNQVIKVENADQFDAAIKYWESQGWPCVDYEYNPEFLYLGVVYNAFGMWAATMGAEIITLPASIPKHGDKILVWKEGEPEREATFLFFGKNNKVHTVFPAWEIEYENSEGYYGVCCYENWKSIPIPQKTKLTLAQIAEKFGIAADQIEII